MFSGGNGIYLYYSSDGNVISNNSISTSGGTGIEIHSCIGNNVVDNFIDYNTNRNIVLVYSDQNTISNNNCHFCATINAPLNDLEYDSCITLMFLNPACIKTFNSVFTENGISMW